VAGLLEAELHVLLELCQLLLQLADLKLRLLQLPGQRTQLALEVIDADRQPGLVLASAGTAVIVHIGRWALSEILGNNDRR
jgi:hypothetical protein